MGAKFETIASAAPSGMLPKMPALSSVAAPPPSRPIYPLRRSSVSCRRGTNSSARQAQIPSAKSPRARGSAPRTSASSAGNSCQRKAWTWAKVPCA